MFMFKLKLVLAKLMNSNHESKLRYEIWCVWSSVRLIFLSWNPSLYGWTQWPNMDLQHLGTSISHTWASIGSDFGALLPSIMYYNHNSGDKHKTQIATWLSDLNNYSQGIFSISIIKHFAIILFTEKLVIWLNLKNLVHFLLNVSSYSILKIIKQIF